MCINWEDHEELKRLKDKLSERYEVLEHLGQGAYGKVFKIKDIILERECALKILNMDKFDTHDDREDAKKRFIKEAKTYAKCEHFSIVPIYDVGVECTTPYLIMKYIKGKSLKNILKERTKLSVNEIMKISGHILPALGYIHSKGLIHRDLKPANIMIEEETERSILIDFGIVKDLETLGGTKSGIIIGTPYYMAPEQFSDFYKVGPKSDIYSFGVALYEMLTGEVPFKGEKAAIIMYEHLDAPVPDVRKKNPDLPVGIEKIIFKAMAKKPNDRFKSARDFLNDLSQIEETQKMIVREKKEEITEKIKPKEEDEEKKARKVELDQEEKIKIKKEEKEKIVEAKIESEKRAKGKEEKKEVEKKEAEKIKEKKDLKKERKSPSKKNKYYIISALVSAFIAAIVAFFVFDPIGIIRGNSNVKINYFEKTERMKGDFQRLTEFLKGGVSNKEKLGKCREFLAKHQNIPGNNEKDSMVSATDKYIKQLETEITTDKEYQKLIASAKESIQNKDYETATGFLGKAKAIKNTEEIKSLLEKITNERIAGMKADFDDLNAFLNGEASNKDKLEKCREFLNKHQTVPDNDERTSMVSETNNFIKQLQAEIGKDEQYQICIDAAKEYIKSAEYQKAIDELEKAKKIKRDTEEAAALSKEIREKQIKIMQGDFNNLKQFLGGGATKKEKINKCQKFLEKHKNTPRDNLKRSIENETNQFISQLNTDIRAEEQYQRHIDNVNRLIKTGDYQMAEDELNKARDIKNTDEVKQLSMTISKRLEAERKNGDKEYNIIRDKMNLSKYLAFKKKYPDSNHLLDLREILKRADKSLPPEKYWENPIKENRKGYYELTFGSGNIRHLMIFIPEKKIWIDKYEVSWAQFRQFIMDAKIQFPPIEDDKFIRSSDEYPAVIPYEYARKYCQKYGLRLPGIDEWEYAAGAGRYTYPWGNASPDKPDTNGNWMANFDSLEGTVERDGFDGTAPVKSFEKFSSPFGVVNMAGNVWEWVQGNILKGGGFFSSIADLKIKSSKPGNNDKEGFRCVKDEK